MTDPDRTETSSETTHDVAQSILDAYVKEVVRSGALIPRAEHEAVVKEVGRVIGESNDWKYEAGALGKWVQKVLQDHAELENEIETLESQLALMREVVEAANTVRHAWYNNGSEMLTEGAIEALDTLLEKLDRLEAAEKEQ